jgi:hypothetical protein
MNELVQAVKATGSIELLSFVQDPKSKKNCKKGHMDFDLVNSG